MKVNIKRTIHLPVELIWQYLGDYANIHRFHPLLKGSGFINNSSKGEVGATRQCDLNDGGYIREKVTEWKEGSHYSIDVMDTTMPVKDARATLGVRKITETSSEVFMNMEMEPENKLMQPFMYLMFKYKVGAGILKGLEDLAISEHQISFA